MLSRFIFNKKGKTVLKVSCGLQLVINHMPLDSKIVVRNRPFWPFQIKIYSLKKQLESIKLVRSNLQDLQVPDAL